jgi:ABC-type multidrug transport system ATPase subunit/ABC-type multidrug transport system permease subunit
MSDVRKGADLRLYDDDEVAPQVQSSPPTPVDDSAPPTQTEASFADATPLDDPVAAVPKVETKKTPPAPRTETIPSHVSTPTAAADVETSQRPQEDIAPLQKAAELYPIVNGKRDFSKSPAQQAQPGKQFDSDVTICYRDVNVKVSVPNNIRVKNVISPITDGIEGIKTGCESCKSKDFYRIKDVSGIIRPGTMTLVLSGPGEGKSTYLRALANRIPISSGRVVYNGRTYDEAQAERVDLTKMTQFVDQVDTHLPLLTVDETLDFAHQMTSVKYDRQRVEDIITLLGLEECRNTIIGNALIRGISGGQRKRVTTGELLVSDASVLFLDEYSNGLDSSTAEDIAKGLKKFCQKYNSSIVATLQQPTPELFAMFDRIVVLREGQVVFDGPVDDVVPYFAAMGFKAPGDVDTADFLIECLSQPRSVILRQKEEELYQQKKAGKTNGSNKKTTKPQTIDTTYGPIQISPQACITTEEMIDFYHATPQWKEIEGELNRDLPLAQVGSNGQESYPKLDMNNYKPLVPTEQSKAMYGLGYRLPIKDLLSHVISRQFKIFIRNTATLIPRLIMAVMMGFIYGSLYWDIPEDNYILRLAAATIAVSQVAFGNFVEIPIAAQGSLVVKKQMAARFYPSWTYSLASWLTSFPMCIVESLIYSFILYWMSSNYPGAAEFILYAIILICTSLLLSMWFRFLAAVGGNEAAAQSMAGPSTGVMMVFAGLFVSRSSIPNFMIWLYWISPFSWAVRSLCNVEFLSSRYDKIISQDNGVNIRAGQAYLATVDMQAGGLWIGLGCLYLVGLSIVVVILNAWFLNVRFYEESIGTRRSDDEELVEGDVDTLAQDVDNDDQLMKEQVQAAALQHAQIEQSRTTGGSQIQSSANGASATARSSGGGSNALQTLREHLPFAPAWVSFSDVSYTVKVEKDKQMVDRILLHHVNGYAQPGKMLALMGASGAGKTTLLDVIAGLKNTGVVEGKILINGQPATKDLISSVCGYVEQFDTLFPYSTVRETLLFAARLRLPRAISDDIKNKIVDEIIDILDLTSMQNYMIGNANIQGLSPAQCKRVNIGVELVANPAVIFLDEPTTGLDSKNAMTVMKVVKRIARSGRAIICTIHQPSAELFFLFDRLLLLGAGGHQIYFGDLGRRAQGFVKYLSRCPGITPIKPRVNPASWMLVELGVGVAAEKGDTSARFQNVQASADQVVIEDEPEWADLSPAQKTVQKFKKMYLLSSESKKTLKRLAVLESIETILPDDQQGIEKYQKEVELAQLKRTGKATGQVAQADENSVNTSKTTLPSTTLTIPPNHGAYWYTQLLHLFVRNGMAYWRNPTFIYSRYGVQLLLSIIFGLIYLGIDATNVSSATSLVGAIFMGVIFSAISIMTTAIVLFYEARPTFYREKASKYYLPFFWALCQLLIEIVWTIPSLAVTILTTYFMIGLQNDAGLFFQYVLFTFVLFLVYLSVAMTLASLLPNSGAAGVLGGAFLSFQNAVSGVSITQPSMPRFWRFFLHVFPASHVLRALLMPQIKPLTTPMKVFSNGVETTMEVREYLQSYLGWSVNESQWEHMGWALLFIACLQVITFTATTFLAFNKR